MSEQERGTSLPEDTVTQVSSPPAATMWRLALVSSIVGALVGAATIVALWSATASARRDRLEVRTVPLVRLSADDAMNLLTPYIVSEGGAVYRAGLTITAITIRERRERMDDLLRVLREYDHLPATVTLSVKSLVASERRGLAEELAPVSDLLASLAGSGGLQVSSSETVSGAEGQVTTTQLGNGSGAFLMTTEIVSTHVQDTTVSVRLRISVGRANDSIPLLRTDLTVPVGRSVVIGTARASGPADRRPLILLTPTRIVR